MHVCIHTYIHTYIQTDRHTYIHTWLIIQTHQSNISNRYIYIYIHTSFSLLSKIQHPSFSSPALRCQCICFLDAQSSLVMNACFCFFQILGWNEVHLRMEKLLIKLLAPRLQPWILSWKPWWWWAWWFQLGSAFQASQPAPL